MKNLIVSLFTGAALLTGSVAFAQTKEEHHAKLSEYHSKTQEHASKSANGGPSTKEVHNMNAEEAGKHLENAKAKHTDLKNTMPEKYKAVAKPHHEAIDKYHREATTHHMNMKAEAAKANYDESKVKEHAKKMHTSVGNAEKEHQMLKSKTSK
jgi:hypothetical protein